jgi:hypothetical protein
VYGTDTYTISKMHNYDDVHSILHNVDRLVKYLKTKHEINETNVLINSVVRPFTSVIDGSETKTKEHLHALVTIRKDDEYESMIRSLNRDWTAYNNMRPMNQPVVTPSTSPWESDKTVYVPYNQAHEFKNKSNRELQTYINKLFFDKYEKPLPENSPIPKVIDIVNDNVCYFIKYTWDPTESIHLIYIVLATDKSFTKQK